jgi:hypothetical protein
MGVCCCNSNRQAAFVMGIIFVVLNIVGVILGKNATQYIATGLIFAVINGVLIFGAHTSNSTAILVWMVLGGIEAVVYCIYIILLIMTAVTLGAHAGQFGSLIGLIVAHIIIDAILVGVIIWTIVIAKRARQEIDNPNPNVNKA